MDTTVKNGACVWRAIGVSFLLIMGCAGIASAQLVFEDLTGVQTAQDLAESLAGAGVTVQNVTYTGSLSAAGSYTGGDGIIGLSSGVVLSTGLIQNAVGPNECPNAGDSACAAKPSGNNGTAGDADLDAQVGSATLDAASLEFELIPDADSIFIQYVFASDEYNEYVASEFNDAFALFVNGVNCAQIKGVTVSINNVNNGNPTSGSTPVNPAFFIDNDPFNPTGPVAGLDTEMDGLTVPLVCEAPVNAGVVNLVKLVIADAVDGNFDSNVYLRAQAITTTPMELFADGFESGDTTAWSATVN